MADEQKQTAENGSQAKAGSGDGQGRIHNSQDPAVEQKGTRNDISNVDQQEGDMNNGECGGNLTPSGD